MESLKRLKYSKQKKKIEHWKKLIYEYYILENNEKSKQMMEYGIVGVKNQDKKVMHYCIMRL
jgi:hypothetical protein